METRWAEWCHGCPRSNESVELADTCPPPSESAPRHAPSPLLADWSTDETCEDERCERLGQGETTADVSMPAGPSKGAPRGSRVRAVLDWPMMRESSSSTFPLLSSAVGFVESSSTAQTPQRARHVRAMDARPRDVYASACQSLTVRQTGSRMPVCKVLSLGRMALGDTGGRAHRPGELGACSMRRVRLRAATPLSPLASTPSEKSETFWP